ncbi:Cyclic nucleotide-binding domain-containing protein [Cyclonatronum proteinivorum]|uniref:histidine kinase n=1 Tax=Cyclonatronum proteinivorum TaxID=1457365 RepID=A0A345UP30_9BACT|nr:ATP-binding protein [Cyclonatronum proteinivorum]AXJ02232.1 Cyclic nucleotide-binding domain-containing protein [Cyclonatronum proteinivorum]
MANDERRMQILRNSRDQVLGQMDRIEYGAAGRRMDKDAFVKTIKELLPGSELLSRHHQTYEKGEIILRENQDNRRLFVILSGSVNQLKKLDDIDIAIDLQGPGDFMGLLSFTTGQPVFTTARANTQVEVLRVGQSSLDKIQDGYPEISKIIQRLIFYNLSERYRRVVTLHMEVAQLSRELEKERNNLRNTITELEQTRNLLINQEKMATLGELTAGLAHEINNPASALLRSVDYLTRVLPEMAEQAGALPDTGLVRAFLEAGLAREMQSTGDQRNKMREIQKKYPHLSRSVVRDMAELSNEMLEKIEPYANNSEKPLSLRLLLDSHQAGVFLGSIKLSTGRIGHLVKSLKSYSRDSRAEPEVADIRLGIQETLMIIGNRLRDVDVTVNLPEIPMVRCYVGELNQVWTNIIINACDAMEDTGKLYINCGTAAGDMVWVTIADDGPGVPDNLKAKIFDSSFTTKTAGGEFGLGIGLAITRSIIQKHSGTISVRDRMGGGAEFIIHLPAYKK